MFLIDNFRRKWLYIKYNFFLPKCSVSCGSGIRVRGVECVNLDGAIDQNCDESKMPERMEACSTGIACPIQHHLELVR